METDFSKLSNYHKVERFIQNLGPVTRDQIHEFINDHNMPEGMQICNDQLAAKVIEEVDGMYRNKDQLKNKAMKENYKAFYSQDGKDYEANVALSNPNEHLQESKKIDSVAEQVKSIANNSDCKQKIEKDDIKIVKL